MVDQSRCLELIQAYLEYLDDEFTATQFDRELCQITTPYWRPDGDHIEVFARSDATGAVTFTDEGQTFDWLFTVGLNPEGAKGRQELIEHLAETHGVVLNRGIFSYQARAEDIGKGLHIFLTFLRTISDLTFFRRQRAAKTFKDEVALFLFDNKQDFRPNFTVVGKTVEHTIDFHLNSGRNWLLETFSPTPSSVNSLVAKMAFKWFDIRTAELGYVLVTLLNDTTAEWDELWSREKMRRPLEEYSDNLIFWSQRTRRLLR